MHYKLVGGGGTGGNSVFGVVGDRDKKIDKEIKRQK